MKGFVIIDPQKGELYSTRVEGDPMIYRSKLTLCDGRQITGLFHCEGFGLNSRVRSIRAFEHLLNFGEIPEASDFSLGIFRTEDLRGTEVEVLCLEADYVALISYPDAEKSWCLEQNLCAYSITTSAANLLLSAGNSPLQVIKTLSQLPEY